MYSNPLITSAQAPTFLYTASKQLKQILLEKITFPRIKRYSQKVIIIIVITDNVWIFLLLLL